MHGLANFKLCRHLPICKEDTCTETWTHDFPRTRPDVRSAVCWIATDDVVLTIAAGHLRKLRVISTRISWHDMNTKLFFIHLLKEVLAQCELGVPRTWYGSGHSAATKQTVGLHCMSLVQGDIRQNTYCHLWTYKWTICGSHQQHIKQNNNH